MHQQGETTFQQLKSGQKRKKIYISSCGTMKGETPVLELILTTVSHPMQPVQDRHRKEPGIHGYSP